MRDARAFFILTAISRGLIAALVGTLVGTLGATPKARAEYRAFTLAITNVQTGQARTVTSNLDDIQYAGYYPVRKTESIQIAATWMCWGRTGWGKRVCPNPKANPSNQPPPLSSSSARAPSAAAPSSTP